MPEMRRRQSRTAMGRFLRDNFKKELSGISDQGIYGTYELSPSRDDKSSSRIRSLSDRYRLGVRRGLSAMGETVSPSLLVEGVSSETVTARIFPSGVKRGQRC